MTYLNPANNFPQKATYWAKGPNNGYGGKSSWAAPIIIKCRWEAATSEELSVAYKVSGEIVVSMSIVYTPVPLEEGAYLFLGETAETLPPNLAKAFVIRSTHSVPSVRGDITEYSVHL